MKIITLRRHASAYFCMKPVPFGILCFLLSALLNPVFANPQGGVVVGGSATISTPAPNTVQINQTSGRAIIDWQSYNVGGHESVRYIQPNSGSISLNKINPMNGASQIYGSITANGQVWLINPAGIYFGPNAYVDVGGILATTASIRNQDFMAGRYQFTQSPNWQGSIINDGRIVVHQAGLAAFIGTKVVNNGSIEANLGTVVLGSGPAYTIDFSGDQLIQFAVQPAKGSVRNNGQITANGGKVILEARSAGKVLDNVINMNGIIEAKSVSVHKGEIILNGGDGKVVVSGKMLASGKKAHQKGGTVKIRSKQIEVVDNALIDTSGFDGGGTILIGGDVQGSGTEPHADFTKVSPGVTLKADALQKGNGGKVIVWADKATDFGGNIYARGGLIGGDGGFVETSGKQFLNFNNPHIDTSAPKGKTGTWLLDPTSIWIANSSSNAQNAVLPIPPMSSDSPSVTSTANTTYLGNGSVNESWLDADNTLSPQLATSNVVVITTNVNGAGAGDIYVVDPISWTSGNTLSLNADRNIILNAPITTGNAASALILNAPGLITQTQTISGSGGLTKMGASTMTMTKTNTYSGLTSINGGTISVTVSGGLGSATTGTTVANGATLELNGSFSISEPLTLYGTGVATNDGALKGTGTPTASNSIVLASDSAIGGSGSLTLSGVIAGSGFGLTKVGTGTLSLSNVNNSYSGATNINGGTVIVNKMANSGTISSLGTGTASPTIGLNGGKLSYVGTGIGDGSNRPFSIGSGGGTIQNTNVTILTLGGAVTGGGNVTYDITGTGNILVGGVISGTGTSLTKTGSGTGVLQLNAGNTYTGATTISAGQVNNSIANALPTSTALTVDGVYNLNGNAQTIGSLSGSGIIRNTGGQILTVGDSTSTIFSGNIGDINGNGLALIKQGTGSLTLTGKNGYTGTTTISINGGTLVAAHSDALGASGGTANTTINSGGALVIANVTILESIILNSIGVGVDAGGLSASGTSAMTGTLAIATNSAIGGTGTLSINGVISGSGALTKEGTGTVTFTKNNASFSGVTTINNGVLSITDAGGLGTIAGATIVNNGGTLDLKNVAVGSEVITLNGSGYNGAGALTGTNTSSLSGPITLASDTTIGGSGNLTLTGVMSDGVSNFNLTKTGSGTLFLNPATANTFDGSTTINQGTLKIAADGALGNAPASATIQKLIFTGGTLETTGSFTLNSNRGIRLDVAGGTIQVDSGADLTYGGIADGYGILNKTGSGILILGGANTYLGATNISAGTLALNGNNSVPETSAVVLGTGATFDLNGHDNVIGSLASTDSTSTVSSSSGIPLLEIGNDNTSTTYAGLIQDAISIIKSGTGTLTLSNTANTYSGQTSVYGGTLSVSKLAKGGENSSLGNSAADIILGSYFDRSGDAVTLSYSGSGDTTDRKFTIDGSGGGIIQTTDATSILTLSGAINSNTNFDTGIGNPITFDAAGTINVSGQITGTGTSLTKIGSGMLSLAANNSYTGGTDINAGTVRLTNTQGLGVIGTINVAYGAALDLDFGNNPLGNSSSLTLNGFGIGSTGALTFSNNNITINNPIILDGATLISGTGTGLMSFGGSIDGPFGLAIYLPNAGIKLPKTTLTNSFANLAVTGGGPISQNGTLAIGGTSGFDAGAHTIDLSTNGSNNIFSGDVTLINTGDNAVKLDSLGALQLNTSTLGGSLTVKVDNPLTLIGSITAKDIKLGTTLFTNSVGQSALIPNKGVGGRWLVWSSNPNPFGGITPDNTGGLVYGFKQYNLNFSDSPTPTTGNGLLYSFAPVITAKLTGNVSRTYDGTLLASLNSSNYIVSGAVDNDSVTLNLPTTGAYDTKNAGTGKNVSASGISFNHAKHGVAQVYGYTVIPDTENASIGEIKRAPITIGAQSDSRTYNGTTSSSVKPLITSGEIFTGDSITTDATQVFDKKNVGTNLLLTASGLVINDGNNGGNYQINYDQNFTGEITPATVFVNAQHDSRTYNGTTSSDVHPVVSGIFAGDTITSAAIQTFLNKNVGTNLFLTASGLVIDDGNGGNNYSIAYNKASGEITQATVDVHAQHDARVYNGTTSSSVNPVVSGIFAGDSITTAPIQVFDNKHVGTGKTLSASGLVINDSNGGANYLINYYDDKTGVITKAPLSVTAQANSRGYNGTTNSVGIPIVSGIMYDAVGTKAIQKFNNKNAGSGKALIASGLIMNDGNGGNNYNVTYINNNTGVISKAPLTVTAKTDTRVYNGTTNSIGIPTVSGVMYDAVGTKAIQKFNNKNAGSGKALIASGLIMNDGNSGNNYLITYINNNTGVISKAPLTVTAKTHTRNYNGTTTSTIVPTITGNRYDLIGTLPKQKFSNKNAGINKLLIASGLIMNDGNAGNNYNVTYINNSTGIINKAPLTVTAKTNTRVYNATTSSNVAPTMSGTMYDAIAIRPTQAFSNKNAGTSKQIIAKGLVMNDGNAGNNYKITYITNNTGVITKAPLTVKNLVANSKIYDATTKATLNFTKAALAGVYAGDSVALNKTTYTANFVTASPGTGIRVVVHSLGVVGTSALNYTLVLPTNLSASILPKPR